MVRPLSGLCQKGPGYLRLLCVAKLVGVSALLILLVPLLLVWRIDLFDDEDEDDDKEDNYRRGSDYDLQGQAV